MRHHAPPGKLLRERPLGRDLVILTLVCATTSMVGLDAIGLVNWQESIRLVTAIDMHERGAWLTPTVNGEPYLAKPPVMYIAVRAIAEARSLLSFSQSSTPTTFDLRLAAAIFGWISVLLTCLATRSILTPESGRRFAHTAGLWAGLFLATGILHVRSSRIGEVDISIVPFVIGGVWAAWSFLFNRGGWRAIIPLALCAAGAMLAKGPPALAPLLIAVALGALARPINSRTIANIARPLLLTLALAGVGALTLWLWSRAIAIEFGPDTLATAAKEETGENLTLLDPRAPIRTLEAMAYAVGLGSLGLLPAIYWMIRERPKLSRGFVMILGWALVVPIVFALIGSGAGRYITPVWPAIAIVAAVWFTEAISRVSWARWFWRAEFSLVLILAVGQGWWYGIGRATSIAEDSPRDLIQAVLQDDRVDPDLLAVLGIWTGALDVYAGTHVEPVQLGERYVDYPNAYWNLDGLRAAVERDGDWTLLVPESTPDGPDPWDALARTGLAVERLDAAPAFIPMKGWGSLVPVRVSLETSAMPAGE